MTKLKRERGDLVEMADQGQFAETHDATLVSYTDQKRVDAFHAKYNRRKD